MYKLDSRRGGWIPYVKWERYRGAEKDTVNTPFSKVHEIEAGVEWQIRPELELAIAHSHMDRTNVRNLVHVKDANLMRFQLQWNY